ncbi:MADF domain-containing protein [Trichostrongylus colubriformis]|uniref:MADF domain-containing protein n=1 Tax=Trichostrongylus colubriformis TaxID=6319 RepID=A0AAN8J372_TRICO
MFPKRHFWIMDYSAKCRLIRLIEEEEPIWNNAIEDYGRLDKKNASWNRVHKEMLECGFNGGMLELKTTWKNLRDQWRKNSLNKSSGSNSKPWTFEKHLLFLGTAQTEV